MRRTRLGNTVIHGIFSFYRKEKITQKRTNRTGVTTELNVERYWEAPLTINPTPEILNDTNIAQADRVTMREKPCEDHFSSQMDEVSNFFSVPHR